MCGAMVYMLLAAGAVAAVASGAHPGMAVGGPPAAGRFPLLALVLAVFMVGYVMWQADRLPALARAATGRPGASVPWPASLSAPQPAPDWPLRPGPATPGRPASPAPRVLSPRLAACCQIAMAVTMGYMLILML